MRTLLLLLLLNLQCVAAQQSAHAPQLGEPVSAEELLIRDSLIFPDGTGLPSGSGGVETGRVLFSAQCVLCHGDGGRGGSAQELSGGNNDLTRDPPDKTIGSYWPYATTLFDFIRRSMPMHIPGSLSDDDVYALTAYLLYQNGIIKKEAVMNAESLKSVRMPNRDGFIWIDATEQGDLK